ncbi:MAG TPA: OprD family outer membrane porin, partial [Verrucomicrobium sp.]|nr:OprD family outer membrane porin [Verrucomicrobium sp.]
MSHFALFRLYASMFGGLLIAGMVAVPGSLRAQQSRVVGNPVRDEGVGTSVEQGQTPLDKAFEGSDRKWQPAEKRKNPIEATQFSIDSRTMYLGRHHYSGAEGESLATGGWAGVKTGYFAGHLAFGMTAYTSQHLYGDQDKDGALLLARGQEGYTALGELYADVKLTEGLNFNVGRKEYDTPFINRNDNRLTPNTFEAISLLGGHKVGNDGASLRYGLGYVDTIKERNSDEFVSMSVDAGAKAERGVFAAGALYKKGSFSWGGIDYYSPDIINIAYSEIKLEVPINEWLKPRFAMQFVDQRSVGDDLLLTPEDSAQLYGFKAELPVGAALLT